MDGERNLKKLLETMKPQLHEGECVFCTVPETFAVPFGKVIGTFREDEGTTLILSKPDADAMQLEYHFTAAWITLTVHSSLKAVGLTAAFAKALADENLSCNVVAAYYHDHIFVDIENASRAMNVLEKLAENALMSPS